MVSMLISDYSGRALTLKELFEVASISSPTHRNIHPNFNLKIIGISMLCLLLVFLTKIEGTNLRYPKFSHGRTRTPVKCINFPFLVAIGIRSFLNA